MLTLAWRLLRRELRSGELRLLAVALLVAVAAMTAVAFLTTRLKEALTEQAHQLLGADLLIVADHPLPPDWRQLAQAAGLTLAETRTFPSMVLGAAGAQLADVKAVSAGYPLRGALAIADAAGAAQPVPGRRPEPGTVWVDERLLAALGAAVGDTVQLGQHALRIAAVLLHEPDRAINFLGVAPRLMMALEDLPATGLEQPGARLTYRLLAAGSPAAQSAFRAQVVPRLGRGERLEDASQLRPETRSALDQAERFLGLSSLLTVVLAALAVALATRRYAGRHYDACALLRCLGLTQRQLLTLHLCQFLVLAMFTGLLGSLLGYAGHGVLVYWLQDLMPFALPAPGLGPVLQGVGLALSLILGFAVPPVLRLARVPTLRVLRRELGPAAASVWLAYLAGGGVLAAWLVGVAGHLRLGLLLVAGFALSGLLAWGCVRGMLIGLGRWAPRQPFALALALGTLRRHASAAALQAVALALGLMALILLTQTRGELLASWERRLPPDAPNRFVINLQPDQRTAFAGWLAARGIASGAAPLQPMVRGRLVRIGDRPVSAASYPEDERAQRLVEREFNLSWREDLPPGNTLTAGDWFPPGSQGQGLASVEAGLAKTLGIALGDTLVFQVAGDPVTVRVSSLRKLDWDSMRVNFFVLMPPGVLDPGLASYITSFHLPAGTPRFAAELARDFPNLTLIDISVLLAQLQKVMGQLASAVQFMFAFTLLAGVFVLQASLLGALDERRQTLAVLRALGATRQPLALALALELALSGGLAGLLAAVGASVVGQGVSERVFELSLPIHPLLWPGAALAGALLSLAAGWWATRRLLRVPPMLALRGD